MNATAPTPALLAARERAAAAIAAWDAATATLPFRPLPDVVEDHDRDLWVREQGTVDSFRLWLADRAEVRTLDELREAFGPIYPAGSAL